MFTSEKDRRVSYGLTVSEAFIIRRIMSADLIKDSITYWSRYGLSVHKKTRPIDDTDPQQGNLFNLVLDGGSLWTEDFENYRKVIAITFVAKGAETEIYIKMELPYAWHVSFQEREKASKMIIGFHNYLEKMSELMQEYVKEVEAPLT